MPESRPADPELRIDASLLARLGEISAGHGDKLYGEIRDRLAQGRDETAITLHVLAVSLILGMLLKHLPNPDEVSPQVNTLWKLLGVPFHAEITRTQ